MAIHLDVQMIEPDPDIVCTQTFTLDRGYVEECENTAVLRVGNEFLCEEHKIALFDYLQPMGGEGIEQSEMSKSGQQAAISLITSEREKQRNIWGDPHDDQHTRSEWGTILRHELGDLAVILLTEGDRLAYRRTLAKVAACAQAALEADYRKDEQERKEASSQEY